VPIRLIAIDIDGTLLDSKYTIPENNIRAIGDAVRAGIEVALVTGRRFDFARPIAEQLHAPVTMIVNNGALVRTSDGVTRIRHLLSTETARTVLEATRDFRDGTAVVFDRPHDNQVVYERIDWNDPTRKGYFERNREYLDEIDPLENCLTEDPLGVMFTGTIAHERGVAQELRRMQRSDLFSLATTEYPARDFAMVDVANPRVSKGAALAEWTAVRGYSRQETMAIGDNHNDREMLEFAGLPIVMGNCVDALRCNGWRLTLSNDEGGVAAAIDEFALGGAR
jgi:Cof subfamily protein (haloacid dehalogenase superfamily)